jgi:single-strand DNA-binding protein
MSGSMNKVILIGNLGRDPELKMSPAGQALARFSVATTETWKNPQGEKQSKTEWHNIVVWGKQAEIAEKYLRKGKQVMVEGRIQYREYTDQQGVKKTAATIRADNFVMLGRAEEGQRHTGAEDFDEPLPPPSAGGSYDDDIPFE